MRTFLEVEGKLGPIPQLCSNQYRQPQPDTNPNVRKSITNPRKEKDSGTQQKVLRPIWLARPNEAAAQPPTTISKAPTDIKIQAQEENSRNLIPTTKRCPNLHRYPMA